MYKWYLFCMKDMESHRHLLSGNTYQVLPRVADGSDYISSECMVCLYVPSDTPCFQNRLKLWLGVMWENHLCGSSALDTEVLGNATY